MTPEELAALMADAIDPNKAPEALIKIREHITALTTTSATLAEKTEADQKTIAELRDTNMRLFLHTGAAATTEEPAEETPEQIRDNLRKKLFKED